MINGLKSCLPLGKDFLNKTRNITTSALSSFFPFTSSFFKNAEPMEKNEYKVILARNLVKKIIDNLA